MLLFLSQNTNQTATTDHSVRKHHLHVCDVIMLRDDMTS